MGQALKSGDLLDFFGERGRQRRSGPNKRFKNHGVIDRVIEPEKSTLMSRMGNSVGCFFLSVRLR